MTFRSRATTQTKEVATAWRCRLGFAVAGFVLCELWAPTRGWAFPPYRSTDADTAEEGVVEVRGGLLGIERESQKNAYFSPLHRAWSCYWLHENGERADAELVKKLEGDTLVLRLVTGPQEG